MVQRFTNATSSLVCFDALYSAGVVVVNSAAVGLAPGIAARQIVDKISENVELIWPRLAAPHTGVRCPSKVLG
jgi:hypothetical protein